AALRRVLDALPQARKPEEIRTEADSIAEEVRAEAVSAILDRRDVPGRETPLHLAVRFGDAAAAEMLIAAGADWSLQNEHGWSALQEAICAREEALARVIVRHYQPLAWAKWCRRLPRVVAAMRRMRDFYMEITFHFESSVIPFISRIAPSDTYRVWKRGANLRADMTLAGFDGFKIQRSDQTILFLGEGSEDGKVPPGSLCMINHKDKEVMNALEGAGAPASEAEVQQEVTAMSQTNIFRPGIDVTQAVLLPQVTWRRQERTEAVGLWKAKVYDMHHVMVSVKSRRVPGAMTDEEKEGRRLLGEEDGIDVDLEEDDGTTNQKKKNKKRKDKAVLTVEGSSTPSTGKKAKTEECHQVEKLVRKHMSEYEKRDKEKDQDGIGGKGRGGRAGHLGKAPQYQGKPARCREKNDCDEESDEGDEEETNEQEF
ncbi:ankyrin repeat domain-containing protein 13B-like, partial [Triticum dicoccoides]|uniref:ankyrin repeat domain-containing protein 13B-like n=1 Tax=Triticum dicoccoides TaxID=85692 RepID=UPI00188F8C6D